MPRYTRCTKADLNMVIRFIHKDIRINAGAKHMYRYIGHPLHFVQCSEYFAVWRRWIPKPTTPSKRRGISRMSSTRSKAVVPSTRPIRKGQTRAYEGRADGAKLHKALSVGCKLGTPVLPMLVRTLQLLWGCF